MLMSLIRISLRETASKAKNKRNVEITELLTFLLYIWFLFTHLFCPYRLRAAIAHMCLVVHTHQILSSSLCSIDVPSMCTHTRALCPRAPQIMPASPPLGALASDTGNWTCRICRSLSIHGFITCRSDYTSTPKVLEYSYV